MITLPVKIRFEQAVYGSFAFWDRGYAVLAQSPGCRPEWLADLKTVCQRCGEPPAGAVVADNLFALRLKSGPWMIVGVHPQGCDDQGRPGALAFHALFVGPWAYRWAGSDPFAFARAFRDNWSLADRGRPLPSVTWTVTDARARLAPTAAPGDDSRIGRDRHRPDRGAPGRPAIERAD